MANSAVSNTHSPNTSEAEENQQESLLSSLITTNNPAMPTPTILNSSPPSVPKHRGRPRGSKNKPKAAHHQSEPTAKTHVLEIPPGSDIVEMVRGFARSQNAGVSIINGVGRVRSVTVRNPVAHEPSISLGGTHDLLGINGLYVGPAIAKQPHQEGNNIGGGSYSYFSGAHSNYMVVHLAGPMGAVWGGVVMGRLVAASNVLLNVWTFANYEFHRLAPEDPATPDHCENGGSSITGPGRDSNFSAVAYLDDGFNWDPSSLRAPKRPRLSDF